jgi:hypothetical protein
LYPEGAVAAGIRRIEAIMVMELETISQLKKNY